MSGRHVGEESDHEDYGLREDTHQLHHRHQREYLKPRRHAGGVEDVYPIVLVAADIGNEEGDHGENCRHCDVAGDIGPRREERYQPEYVAEEDEEEKRKQIGQIALVFGLAYHRLGYAVAHKDDKHLHKALHTFRRLSGSFLISCTGREDDDYQQYRRYNDSRGGLGDREVEGLGSREVAGLVHTHYLFLLGSAAHKPVAFVVGVAVVETRRHEDVEVPVVPQYHRQGNGHSVLGTVGRLIV